MKPTNEISVLWYTLPLEEAFSHLDSGPQGLSGTDAARRLAEYDHNEVQAAHTVSPWRLLFAQFPPTSGRLDLHGFTRAGTGQVDAAALGVGRGWHFDAVALLITNRFRWLGERYGNMRAA